jgi:glycosyltransferase involved in cell wall biosynthesis
MIRKQVLQKFMYRSEKNAAEDYDLWLRMKAHGFRIAKLEEPMLLYRIHQASVTSNRKLLVNTNLRVLRQKWTFIQYAFSNMLFNAFLVRVIYSSVRSAAAYIRDLLPNALRWCKRLFTISPFKAAQQFKLLAYALNTEKPRLVFFFPYTHMGGAERVHADIVNTCRVQKSLVVFTGFSQNENFIHRFLSENAVVLNIPHCLNSVWYGQRTKQLLADFINAQTTITTFGSNAEFYFKLLPWLHAHVKCVDLIHAFKFQPGANKAHLRLLPYALRLNNRVFISQTAKQDFELFLINNLYGPEVSERLAYIPNATMVPSARPHKSERMKIIFVGRNSPEKRFYLFEQIARELSLRQPTITFDAAGIAQNTSASMIKCHAELNDLELNALYASAHIIVLTSSREGFPLVIMEAMAHGVVPVSTAVGDIPIHVNGSNGFVSAAEDEAQIVNNMLAAIESYINDRASWERTSQSAYNYAKTNFSKDNFEAGYKSLLLQERLIQ